MRHYDAGLHVRGESLFTDDLPQPEGTLHAAVFASPVAHGRLLSLDFAEAVVQPGVVRVVTAEDVPGENQIGNIIMDEKLLADGRVHYIGDPLALVLAESPLAARRAAAMISAEIEVLKPVFSAREAARRGNLIAPPRTFSRGDVEKTLARCDYLVEGTAETGGQEHLYLETQSALCVPGEWGSLRITSSTQGPTFVQKVAARVLNVPIHMIEVDVLRLGGAFGGKEDQATPWAVMAALGAHLTGRPVKLVLRRRDDMALTGKRHPYTSDFRMGLDDQGKILVWDVEYYQNGGAASDLSTSIMERTLFHCTGSYNVPDVRATGYCCRTNLPPNTAFRGFGGPQAMFVMEAALHKAAIETGIPLRDLQERNLLSRGDTFVYGQSYRADDVRESWSAAMELCDIRAVERSADEHNAAVGRYRRGVSVMPVCFGISFTTTFLNQASALVHVYTDGSVGISTAAVEMGQGVNSRIRQVAATELGMPVELTKVESTNTTRAANTSPTAASSGADMNGNATRMACREIRGRLLRVAADLLKCSADELSLADSMVIRGGEAIGLSWRELVMEAYRGRTDLSSHAHYATPGIHFDRSTEKGEPFAYHVAGTAVTEVTVDCLLGTYRIDRVSIAHCGGPQLNPVVDLGQMEGGLVQGIGWITMEEHAWDQETGRLLADALATYKVPDMDFAPHSVRVRFMEGEELADDVGLLGSKAIGEPPFMYGIGTWFAIMDAIRSFAPGAHPGYVAPMTPERVLMTLTDAAE